MSKHTPEASSAHPIRFDEIPSKGDDEPQEKATVIEQDSNYVRCKFKSRREFMFVVLALQLSIVHILQFATFAVHYGGLSFVILYLILYFVIGLPVLMSQFLLGQYGRLGQLQVWRIAPFFYGIGYTMLLLSMLKAVVDSSIIIFSLMFLYKTFGKSMPWSKCSFEGVDKSVCIDEDTMLKYEKNSICCWNLKKTDCVYFNKDFAAFHYWKYMVCKTYNEEGLWHGSRNMVCKTYNEEGLWFEFGNLNWSLIGIMLVVWFVIFVAVQRGLSSLVKLIIFLMTCIGVCMVCFLVLAVTQNGVSHGLTQLFKIHITNALSFKMLFEVFTYVIQSQQLSNGAMILFGTFVDGKYRPDRVTLFVGFIKLFITILFTVFFFSIFGQVGVKYNLLDLRCIMIIGYGLLFALVPEFLDDLPVPQVCTFLFFLSVTIMAIISVVLQIISVLDSIMDAYPRQRLFRTYIVAGLCIFCFICEIPFLTTAGLQVQVMAMEFLEEECSLVIMLLYSIVLFYIYGVVRLADDMEFMLGVSLSQYWRALWYIIPVLMLLAMPGLYNMLKGHSLNNHMRPVNIVLTLLILSPLLIVAFKKYLHYMKKHNVLAMFKTEESWGPQATLRKKARRHFNPRKAVKYKSVDVVCKHNCNITSEYLRAEIKRLELLRSLYIKKVPHHTTTPPKD